MVGGMSVSRARQVSRPNSRATAPVDSPRLFTRSTGSRLKAPETPGVRRSSDNPLQIRKASMGAD